MLLDIDGTITTAGRLGAAAYGALERLQTAGLLVIPVTGRPAGWCDLIARFWPVDAVVGENGALYFRYDHERRRMIRGFARSDAERAQDRERLRAIGEEVLRAVPGAAIAADQLYRDTDLAIDYCEDVPPLPPDAVQRIHALLTARGLTAKVSSIHVNAWFGTHDKLSMTRRLMREQFGVDLDAERDALRLHRRLPQRRADVRVLPQLLRGGQHRAVRRRTGPPARLRSSRRRRATASSCSPSACSRRAATTA